VSHDRKGNEESRFNENLLRTAPDHLRNFRKTSRVEQSLSSGLQFTICERVAAEVLLGRAHEHRVQLIAHPFRPVTEHDRWRLGLRGWPKAAEDIIVARNVILAELTGAHIHMQHVSSANSVDILRRAIARGISVSGEASPHHIEFTDADLKDYNTVYKMNPPLRTDADKEALIEGLCDGTLACIATDHAPHSPDEKDREFDSAPFGIIGLENSLASSLGTLYHSDRLSLNEVVALMTHKGAELCKLDAGTLSAGTDADVCLFDPDEEWTVDAAKFFSKSRNCPWHGKTLKGKVKATYVAGAQVYDGNAITA